jgi:hypothetical protein
MSAEYDLSLGERRVLEALTPAALVVQLNAESNPFRVGIPDSSDLRQIADALGRPIRSVGPVGGEAHDEASNRCVALLAASERHHLVAQLVGTSVAATPTVVRIANLGQLDHILDGDISPEAVVEASNGVSQWEIEDWT